MPEESILAPPELIEVSTLNYGLPSRPESFADRIAIARIRTRRRVAAACRQSIDRSRRAVTDLRNRTRRAKDERPMLLLAAVAGTAFLLGVSLRMWRSHR